MAYENPAKAFRYRVEVDGVDQWAIQKVTLPELSINIVTHGGGTTEIKTAGRKVVGDAVFEKLVSATGADNWAFEWFQSCVLGLPTAYKRNLVVKELSNDGITTIATNILIGAWCSKFAKSDKDRASDDNAMETVTLTCDDMIVVGG